MLGALLPSYVVQRMWKHLKFWCCTIFAGLLIMAAAKMQPIKCLAKVRSKAQLDLSTTVQVKKQSPVHFTVASIYVDRFWHRIY